MARAVMWLLFTLAVADSSRATSFWNSFKRNCGVSMWSEWGPTMNGIRTRTREIYRYPQNGGAPCPCLSDTQIDPWVNRNVSDRASRIESSFLRRVDPSIGSQATIRPRDILFILDMSGSIDATEYEVAKQKIADLIGKICGTIGLENKNNRAAVITFSRSVDENFDFDDHTTLDSLQRAVRALPRDGGSTCTGTALEYAKKMFTLTNGARPDHISVKEVVLLTDGQSNCGPDVVQAAIALQNIRTPPITMFVFAIDDINPEGRKEIGRLATQPVSHHLFHFVSFVDFEDVVNVILTYPDNCAPIEI